MCGFVIFGFRGVWGLGMLHQHLNTCQPPASAATAQSAAGKAKNPCVSPFILEQASFLSSSLCRLSWMRWLTRYKRIRPNWRQLKSSLPVCLAGGFAMKTGSRMCDGQTSMQGRRPKAAQDSVEQMCRRLSGSRLSTPRTRSNPPVSNWGNPHASRPSTPASRRNLLRPQ